MATPLLSIPEIVENQSAKYITHNEALALIEGIITRVLSRTNSGPPSSPSEGDTYIVDSATGDWSTGSVNDIAHYYSGAWHFVSPIEGLSTWCVDETGKIYYDGSSWTRDFTSRINMNVTLNTHDAVGVVDTVTVNSNSYGFGAALCITTGSPAANIFEEADATSQLKMPCMALALESGTGSKQVLFWGRIRNALSGSPLEGWEWTPGNYIYISPTTGRLTQQLPANFNTGEIVQTVGIAQSSDTIFFNPSYVTVEIA